MSLEVSSSLDSLCVNKHRVELCAIGSIRASEMICPDTVSLLADKIRHRGIWTHPIPVCDIRALVMDGNHRLAAATRLGLRRVPVIRLSYVSTQVKVWNRLDGAQFDLARLDQIISERTVLPYKTTRHEFAPPLPLVEVMLQSLI
jgi:ParB-like chromosome segregation protein Spo0J